MNKEFSTEEKEFDAIKFKRKLQENLWKHSKAKNSKEYVEYVNKIASNSSITKKIKKT
jgi:hypothetical protein